MKSSTALNHFQRFQRSLEDIWLSAQAYGSPHAWVLETTTKKIHQDPAWPKCPAWVHERITALSGYMLGQAMQERMVWAFEVEPGVFETDFQKVLDGPHRERFTTGGESGCRVWLNPIYTGGSQWGTSADGEYVRRWKITGRKF